MKTEGNFICDTIQDDNILRINIISDIMLDLYLKQMVQERICVMI